MPSVLLCCSTRQEHSEAPCLGSYSGSSVHQALDGPAPYIVHLLILACGKREAMVMIPLPMCAPAVSLCFHGFLAFLHRHFPPQSPPSHPLHPSLHSQQQPLPWDCSTVPNLQLPVTVPSGDLHPCLEFVWLWQGLSSSFHLGCHRSTVSLLA